MVPSAWQSRANATSASTITMHLPTVAPVTQQCRHPYKVTDLDSGIEIEIDNEYILSPKDLCTIGFLDKIMAAGVKVLKIEGRGSFA